MGYDQNTKVYVPWPTAPGNAATIIMFTTHDKVVTGGTATTQAKLQGLAGHSGLINAVEITWIRNDQASAANGLRLYALDDADAFREVDLKNYLNAPTIGSAAPFAVPVLSTGQEYHALLDVSRYRGLAVEYTAGATGPTNWNGCIQAHIGVAALQR